MNLNKAKCKVLHLGWSNPNHGYRLDLSTGWVIVIGDSLLKGAEGPICRPDPLHREGCCLPGAKDMRKKLPCLVRPPDYYPLLLFQVGSDDIGRKKFPKAYEKGLQNLGATGQGFGSTSCVLLYPSSYRE